LETYSQAFLQFWHAERAAYWPVVAAKEKEFKEQKKKEVEQQKKDGVKDPVVSVNLTS
jgi:hypothetical protein